MRSTGFRWAGRLAAVGMVVTAGWACALALSGALVMAGRSPLPLDRHLGPFHIHGNVGIPVVVYADICQSAAIDQPAKAENCVKFFLHQREDAGATAQRSQDADVRPTDLRLKGEMRVAADAGWNPWLAIRFGLSALPMAAVSVILFLTWRVLRSAALGSPFDQRSTRKLRMIGALVVAAALVEPVFAHVSRLDLHGYWWELFGPGPEVTPYADYSVPWGTVALGVLVLLVAEVFRHGRELEIEQELTV